MVAETFEEGYFCIVLEYRYYSIVLAQDLNKNSLAVKKVRGQSEATMVISDQKGGQVTKPIIVVKMPCKLFYVIQVKGFLIKCSTSWPYLISEFLVAYNHCGF